jgi:hypothetical protein
VKTASIVAVILVVVGYANITDLLGNSAADPKIPKITRVQFDSLPYGTSRSAVEAEFGQPAKGEALQLSHSGCVIYDGYGPDSLADSAGLELCFDAADRLDSKCAEWDDRYGNNYYQCKRASGRAKFGGGSY